MNEAPTTSRTHRLLTAVIILLCVVALLQLGLLLQRHLTSRPPASVWSSSDEMESMHARINRLFDQAFRTPHQISQPPADPAAPPPAQDGSAVSSFQDPFEHMRRMQRQIDAMFAGALNDLHGRPPAFDEGWTHLEITPGFSIRDTDNAYEITVNLPGVDPADIHISLEDSVLGLVVEQNTRTSTTTNHGTTVRRSLQTSRFERHLRLPDATDSHEAIQAVYEQNVLKITVPKSKKEKTGPRAIPVKPMSR